MSDPSVSRYALTTHCWPDSPPPRSSLIAGRATLTAVESRSARNDAVSAATSVSCLLETPALPAVQQPRVVLHLRVAPLEQRVDHPEHDEDGDDDAERDGVVDGERAERPEEGVRGAEAEGEGP